MVEFLFFRHGETDWNRQRIFQGHTDTALNETGQKQAQALARKIQHWKPDVLLTSDLARAYKTGEACQSFWNVPVVQSPLLREMDLGKAEGLHRDEVLKLVGPDFEKWVSHNPEDEDFRFPGGESKSEARHRILSFLEDFCRKNPQYKKIAVSTHGGVLRRVTHALPGTPIEGVPIPNCITYRLNFTNTGWHFINVRERTSAVVVNENKILTFFAIDPQSGQEYHFLPGGLIEPHESSAQCVERETLEETGYTIRALLESVETREYDFVWNGQPVWCRTHFMKGEILNPYEAPLGVNDASYNKGVVWTPVLSSKKSFNYENSIQEAIQTILAL